MTKMARAWLETYKNAYFRTFPPVKLDCKTVRILACVFWAEIES